MDLKKIGDFLKVLRKSKGYTQQEVADALFVTQKTISRWENGEGIPDIAIISSVAEFYDITVDELLKGERYNDSLKDSTIRKKDNVKIKLLANKLLSKQNIYFIISLSISLFFITLGLIIGLLVSSIAGFIIVPFGLVICLALYIYGNYEIKRVIDDEENSELVIDLQKSRLELKKKNILFIDIFYVLILSYVAALFWFIFNI